MKKKQLRKELIIVCALGALFFISCLYSKISIFNMDFINIKFVSPKREDLLFNLFTVQATIAALSISIIAIITGFQTDNYYGISVTNYITTRKPVIFKHKNLMIADLLLTLANYIVVSFDLYNISVVFFIISIVISIILINDTSFIFKKSSQIKNEIKEYALENYSEDYICDLSETINPQIKLENSLLYEDNLELLTEIYKKESNKGNSKITILICKALSKLFSNNYNNSTKEKMFLLLGTIDDIYSISNACNPIIHIDVWDSIYVDFCDFISMLRPSQLRNNKLFNYYNFGINLMKNRGYHLNNNELVPSNSLYAEYYFIYIYKYVVATNKRDDEFRAAEAIKETIYYKYLYSISKADDKTDETIRAYSNFLKCLFDYGDIQTIKNLYLDNLHYHMKSVNEAVVFLSFFIYIYYLAYYETLVKGKKEQQNAQDVLNYMYDFASDIIYYLDVKNVLQNKTELLYRMLDSWEKFENNKVKSIVLQPLIQEFLFFISIEVYYSESDLYDCFRIISSNNCDSLIYHYFSPNDEEFITKFNLFRKRALNIHNTDDIHRILDATKSALQKASKTEQLEKANDRPITENITKLYSEKVKSISYTSLKELNAFANEQATNIKKAKILLNFYKIDKESLENGWFTNEIKTHLYELAFRTLISHIDKQVETLKLNRKTDTKQEQFINLSKKYSPDIFIGNKESFWEETNKTMLSDYISNMTKITIPYGSNELYLINKTKFHFKITNIEVLFKDYDMNDFESLNIEEKGDEYLYSYYNRSIKANYTKTELIELLHKTLKIISVQVEYEYTISEDKIGCSLEITYVK